MKNTTDLGIYILTALVIIGTIILAVVHEDLNVFVPILTALVGVIIGRKGPKIQSVVMNYFNK